MQGRRIDFEARSVLCTYRSFALKTSVGHLSRSDLPTRTPRVEVRDLMASSAGVRAMIGHPIHRDGALVIGRLGGDVPNFAARQLTSISASEADLVLAMTREPRDIATELAPHQFHRTSTLSEAARLTFDQRKKRRPSARRAHLTVNEFADVSGLISQSAEVFAMGGPQIEDRLPPILELCRRD